MPVVYRQLFSVPSHPFVNSQPFGASYNRIFSRDFQFGNLALLSC